MVELSRHIESLLLKHDCVIIPNFGGFVTHHVPAQYVEEERLYLPPTRSVGFNSMLQMNDGVLAQSVMQAEDASFPEAMRLVAEMVAHVKRALSEKGSYTFSNIGTLTYSLDGRYHFTPNEAGVTTPEHYALDSFGLNRLQTTMETEVIEEPVAPTPKAKKKTYTLHIHREWLGYGVASILALALYFTWSEPSADKISLQTQQANVFTQEIFRHPPTPAPAPEVKKEEISEAVLQTSETADAKVENPAPVAQEPETPVVKEGYTLVLASAVQLANAEALAQRLQKEGHSEAAVWTRRKMVRVIYGNYTTEAEAQAQLRTLRKHADFANAWVMKRK